MVLIIWLLISLLPQPFPMPKKPPVSHPMKCHCVGPNCGVCGGEN